jgi:hypothetical protein
MPISDEVLAMLPRRPRYDGSEAYAVSKALLVLIAIVLCLTTPIGGRAQSVYGTLAGTVTDENGAVVQNVLVTAFSLTTALQRQTFTNDNGEYSVPFLPPGEYRVTFEKEGFTVDVQKTPIKSDRASILRVKLKVGEIEKYVTVNARDLNNPDQTGSVAVTFSETSIDDLPVMGKTLQSVVGLIPGVQPTRTNFNEQGQFSADGQRANANYWMLDGVSINFGVSAGAAPGQSAAGSLPAVSSFGTTNNLLATDAVAEMRVQTSTYTAEYGRLPGAQIGLTSRSGTNGFHGTLFEYLRNGALDANDWFVNSQNLLKPPLKNNDFGGVFGGPIRRNRTFFFFSYEGLRLEQPRVALTAVPTLLAREVAVVAIKPLLAAYPLPNGPGLGFGIARFSASYAEPSRMNAASLRLDHQVSSRLSVFGRYSFAPSTTVQRGSRNPPAAVARATFGLDQVEESLSTVNHTSVETQTLTIGANLIVSPTIVNECRVNWSQALGSNSYSLDNFGGATPPPSSYFFPSFASPNNGLVQILMAEFAGSGANLKIGKDADNAQRQINLVDNVTIAAGSHRFKFGVDYRQLAPVYDAPQYTQTAIFDQVGLFPFNNDGTLVSGVANGLQIFNETGPRHPIFHNFSLYAQDSWRVSQRLTLSYGVRWELSPPPSERNGNDPLVLSDISGFTGQFAPATLQIAPKGTPLWATTYNNFAPRAGLAYRPFPKLGTTIRAGLGVYYDTGNGQAAQAFGSVFPYTRGAIFGSSPYPSSLSQATPPDLGVNPPYGSLFAFDPHLKLPYSLQTSLTVEQPLGAKQMLSLSYLGAHGRRLFREEIYEQPSTGSAGFTDVVTLTRGDAKSDYNAFQAVFQRRLSRGLQGFASYTWSHSIDDVSDDSSLHFRPNMSSPEIDRGPSDFDIRHSYSVAFSYDLPTLLASGPLNAVSRNWSFDAVLKGRTATPYNLTDVSQIISGGLVEYERPNLIQGVPLYLNSPSAAGGWAINPAAFGFPSGAFSGSLGRNALRGFGASQIDVVMRRKFNLSDRVSVQLRAEVYNLLNHPNFALNSPNLVSDQTLGQSLGSGGLYGGLTPMYQMGGPRSIQLGLKLQF